MENSSTIVKAGCSISLCMIVKNEEHYLKDCLESVKDIVNQKVIVDTGSTDSTVKIAEDYHAEIYHFEWCDDFAAARQESIKQATGDWILWLDADERLRPAAIPVIQKLAIPEDKAVLYNALIYNKLNKGTELYISSSHRLFTNFKGIYFIGKVHEQLTPSLKAVHGAERESDIVIDHLGFDYGDRYRYHKIKTNRFLLLKIVKQHPRSSDAHFALARHYALTQQSEAALKHYQIAHRLNQFNMAMTASLLNKIAEELLKTGRDESAKEHCLESIKLIASQLEAYNILYQISMGNGHFEEAFNWLKILQINNKNIKLKSTKKLPGDILIPEADITLKLALIYDKLNKWDKSLEYYENYYSLNKNNKMVQQKLLSLYLKLGYSEKAKEMEKELKNSSLANTS